MRTFLITIGISILNFIVLSQENTLENKFEKTKEWTVISTEKSVEIDYKIADCDAEIGYDKELVLLKVTNNSDHKVELKWHSHLYYNGVCKTCDFPEEYSVSIILEPNESLSGDCTVNSDSRLTLFCKFLDSNYKGKSQLTNFELKNIQIITIK